MPLRALDVFGRASKALICSSIRSVFMPLRALDVFGRIYETHGSEQEDVFMPLRALDVFGRWPLSLLLPLSSLQVFMPLRALDVFGRTRRPIK